MTYDFRAIEARWQRLWDEHHTFRADVDPERPKYYALDMFPYPSGDGLHVGHPEGYTATDIVCRYSRMRGKTVMHPMGFDSFGLPAEEGRHSQRRAAAGIHRAEHRHVSPAAQNARLQLRLEPRTGD